MNNGVAKALVVSIVFVLGCSTESSFDAFHQENLEGVQKDSVGHVLSDFSAELVAQNARMDDEFNLVARVEVQPKELVEFYEPGPGSLVVSGAGAPDEGLIVQEDLDLDPAALWKLITHGAPMPGELEAAISRWAMSEKDPEPHRDGGGRYELPSDNADANRVEKSAARGSGWCETTYYSWAPSGYGASPLSICPGAFDFEVCWDDVSGNGGSAEHDDAFDMRSNVCPYIGSVIFKMSSDEGWTGPGSWTVAQNTVRWARATDSASVGDPFNDAPWIRIDIQNATNDWFNFRFLVVAE